MLLVGACNLADEPLRPGPVTLGAVTVNENSNMVTAAVANIECAGPVATIQVSYRGLSDSGSTPRVAVSICPAAIHLLGLLPSSTYRIRVTAWDSAKDSVTAEGPSFGTRALPTDLPQVAVTALTTATTGYTVFTASSLSNPLTDGLALIVDSIGRIRWYLRAHSLLTDLQPHSGTGYTLSVSNTEPLAFTTLDYAASEYWDIDVGATFLGKWTATGGYFTDNHDIRLTARATAVLFGFDLRTVDLQSVGGVPNAQILGNIVEEVDKSGKVFFFWNAFDQMSLSDIDPAVLLTTSRIDWTHGNAIDIDRDENYLISSRNLSEVTKIDARTGAVIWRLGGVRNQFSFEGDTLKFSFQHGMRVLPNGNLTLFDNGNTHQPPFSRAVEYRVDEQARSVTKVWEYRPSPDIYSFFLGFVQRLANGNTLVTFGPQGDVHEVSPSSRLEWELRVAGRTIYRAYRIRSLYEPVLQ